MNNQQIRNFCIIAHIDHGKSTLADRLLEVTGTLTKQQMQSQVLDDMDLERERGITIKSHPIQMEYIHSNGKKFIFNLIDTPGYIDFVGEMKAGLGVADLAGIVVNASEGIEVGTELAWEYSEENNVSKYFIINISPLRMIQQSQHHLLSVQY